LTATELEPAEYDNFIEALKEVIDPEIGVNIVDLGLIYGLQRAEDGSLLINATLTSAGCPLTDVIEEQTAQALDGLTEAFRINWVWMPPWGPEKITEDGKEQMRAIGFAI
jgi:metal-sulfur cluster biosynthetic enzyme